MANKNGLTERLYVKLFHPDVTYQGQFPSTKLPDDMTPEYRLKYDDYLKYIQDNQDRKAAYKDFETMDSDVISSALDLMADDATQFNLEDGESFYVDTENAEIKAILEDLYFNTLHIDENLWDIVRTTAKYGDYFVRVIGEPDVGIRYCDYSLHPERITRIDSQGAVKCFIVDENVKLYPWDIVHFKLPGSNSFAKRAGKEYTKATSREDLDKEVNTSTYGQSAIAKARKTWKQVTMLEDSLILSRLSRAFKRNVFMVNTTGLGETAGWDLVHKIQELLKRNKVVNAGQGMDSFARTMNPEEDIVLPTNGDKGSVNVQELGGDVDIQHIADLDYINNKLFASLKVPKAYLGFEEALNGRNTLRMLDVRYARTIKNLQRVLIIGLERIGRIHLSLKGIDPYAIDFSLQMPYISTIEEVEKTEALSNKVDAVTRVMQLFDQIDDDKQIMDRTALMEYMLDQLGFSDEQIQKLIKPKAQTDEGTTSSSEDAE